MGPSLMAVPGMMGMGLSLLAVPGDDGDGAIPDGSAQGQWGRDCLDR